jgi:hypothetical protein
MFVGDSVMYDELPALKSAFAAAGARTVIDASTFGFGLTNSTVNWRATWPSLVAAQRPDLVVVLLGPWDVSYVQSHGRKAYDGVVNDAVRTLTASGARVLWLGMLPSSAMPQRPVNPTYAALPAKFPGRVSYWELDPVLRGPKGDYPRALVAPNGTPVLIRKPDTEHLCPEGAARIADSVLNRLVALHLSAGAGESWRNGAWRSDPRYDNPPGGCTG